MKRRHQWAVMGLIGSAVACGDASGTGGAGGEATTASSSSSSSSGGGGSGGSGGSGGAACVSGKVVGTPDCTQCQDAHCCLSATEAAEDPGTWTNSAATICREANCWEECGEPQPECGGIVPTPSSCADDLYALCCAEVEACAKSDSCTALIYICIDDRGCSPNSSCFDECALEFPGGEMLFDEFLECFNDVICT